MKQIYDVDVFSIELNSTVKGSVKIEAENGIELLAKCGIAFAANAPITQIGLSEKRYKLFVTDTQGFKFVLDVMKVDG